MKESQIRHNLKERKKAKKANEAAAHTNSLPVSRAEFLALEGRVKNIELSGESPDELWKEVKMLFDTYSNAITELKIRFTITRKWLP